MLSHIPVIVVSIWLLGRREAIWIAVLSLSFGLSLAILDSIGIHLPRYLPVPPFFAWEFALILIGLTILPLASVQQALADSSEQARRELEARRHEERLTAESELRFRATFFQAAVGIAQTNPEGRWLLVNDRLGEILGYTPTELHAMTFLDVTHPDDREASAATLRRFLAGELSSWSLEKRYIRKDGSTVWGRVFTSLIRDPHNQPNYFITVVEDITDKIQAERELRDAQERLRANEVQFLDAQRLAHVGSWELHIEADRIYWSEEIANIFGVQDRREIRFSSYLNAVHPKDREKILEADRRVRSTSTPVETEYRIIRQDGEVRFVRSVVQAVRNERGALVRLAGATQDITEGVAARELLRESETRLKNAERLAHVGHWDWDIRTNRVSWSEEMFHILGRPLDFTPTYEGFLEIVIPQHRDRVGRGLAKSLAERRGGSCEFQITRPNGELRILTCVFEVALDEEGQPIGLFGADQDITDLRRAQQETSERQKLESVGTLAGGIAHDFNNLLGGILAQTELALAKVTAGSHPEEELKNILSVTLRGSEIVRELLIYAGKESPVVEAVDVTQTVREMMELLKVSVSKHAVLESDLGEDIPTVQANAAQLRQLVMNLVMNASEAIGEKDGVIRVTTRCVKVDSESGELSTSLAKGDHVQLEISDTGQGIPSEIQAKIFDPFFTTKVAGHGLGLAIVQGIVRTLAGSIHFKSELGKGTVFRVLMPCAGAAARATRDKPQDNKESVPATSCATVLVVEDEDLLRAAVVKMLRNKGFSVFEASGGTLAMEIIQALDNPIDLLFLDLNIPGTPSRYLYEMAARLRPKMRVIVTTAYPRKWAAEFLQMSVEHFLQKPYRLADLLELIRKASS